MLPLFEELTPAPQPLSRKDHLTFKANITRGRHGWLRLTPAYSVTLVNELVAHCTPDDVVLDPFAGSGTTALACAEAGITCHTVDINPFLVWLTRVKCDTYSPDEISAAQQTFNDILDGLPLTPIEAWIPPIKDIEKWWERPILNLLAAIFAGIDVAVLPTRSKDLLKVVFCRSIIELAAVSFGHQSMSFKKSRGMTTLDADQARFRVRQVFASIGELVFGSAASRVHPGTAHAHHGDSRVLPAVLAPQSQTVVITSPPYPNRMSYIRELRPYMYWLGYLESGREAGELDWKAIGGTWGCATSNLMKWEPTADAIVPHTDFREVIDKIGNRSPVLGRYVEKYFVDAVEHVHSLTKVLAPGATVNYVVGNSRFYDVMLHTEQIYASIFAHAGFTDIRIDTIRKRTSKKELFEYNVFARLKV